MAKQTAFHKFAPIILKIYPRDKEAFWKAVMAPFLKNQASFYAWLQTIKVDVGLLSAFKGLDEEARQTLKKFGMPFGLDVSTWESNRAQYLKDAYPVFAFIAVWMDEAGLNHLVEKYADILRAGVFAVAGYGILDTNVDSDNPVTCRNVDRPDSSGRQEARPRHLHIEQRNDRPSPFHSGAARRFNSRPSGGCDRSAAQNVLPRKIENGIKFIAITWLSKIRLDPLKNLQWACDYNGFSQLEKP